MNEDIERIEAALIAVGGFLLYLQQQYILRGREHDRTGYHEQKVGEALRALMEVKRQLGLPTELQTEEKEVEAA